MMRPGSDSALRAWLAAIRPAGSAALTARPTLWGKGPRDLRLPPPGQPPGVGALTTRCALPAAVRIHAHASSGVALVPRLVRPAPRHKRAQVLGSGAPVRHITLGGRVAATPPGWQYSAEHYVVSHSGVPHSGVRIVSTHLARWQPVLVGRPMVVGDGETSVRYAEFELEELLPRSEGGIGVGVGRPGLDVNQPFVGGSPEYWGMNTGTGSLSHAQMTCWDWSGQQSYARGDTVGLLLDAAAGTLTAYKNGTRLGVMFDQSHFPFEIAAGQLCWVVDMCGSGNSVRFAAKPPPANWRTDTTGGSGGRFLFMEPLGLGHDLDD